MGFGLPCDVLMPSFVRDRVAFSCLLPEEQRRVEWPRHLPVSSGERLSYTLMAILVNYVLILV